MALVFAGTLAEVSRRAGGCGGSFEHTRECWGVVREGTNGLFAHVPKRGDDVKAGERGELFQVAVGDVTVGVGVGDQAGANGLSDGGSPDDGTRDVGEENLAPCTPTRPAVAKCLQPNTNY